MCRKNILPLTNPVIISFWKLVKTECDSQSNQTYLLIFGKKTWRIGMTSNHNTKDAYQVDWYHSHLILGYWTQEFCATTGEVIHCFQLPEQNLEQPTYVRIYKQRSVIMLMLKLHAWQYTYTAYPNKRRKLQKIMIKLLKPMWLSYLRSQCKQLHREKSYIHSELMYVHTNLCSSREQLQIINIGLVNYLHRYRHEWMC